MAKNKELQSEAAKRHYQQNRTAMIARSKQFTTEARQRNRDYIWQIKIKSICLDCGYSDPRALQFHHISDKDGNVADAIRRAWGLEKLKKEIAKCVVLCANCHQIRHFNERSGV